MVSSPFFLRRERHQEASIYNGIMNPQPPYVDANSSCVVVARSLDMYTISASPSSYYVQGPMQNNLHAFSNLQQASAAPKIHMPMNNMMSSVNQYETPNVRNFSSMQDSVSSSYSSVNSSQYMVSALNMPMDR
jgi:hypothetical protein